MRSAQRSKSEPDSLMSTSVFGVCASPELAGLGFSAGFVVSLGFVLGTLAQAPARLSGSTVASTTSGAAMSNREPPEPRSAGSAGASAAVVSTGSTGAVFGLALGFGFVVDPTSKSEPPEPRSAAVVSTGSTSGSSVLLSVSASSPPMSKSEPPEPRSRLRWSRQARPAGLPSCSPCRPRRRRCRRASRRSRGPLRWSRQARPAGLRSCSRVRVRRHRGRRASRCRRRVLARLGSAHRRSRRRRRRTASRRQMGFAGSGSVAVSVGCRSWSPRCAP